MRSMFRNLVPILLAAGMITPAFIAGCTVHAGVYDPYYHDHHVWATEEPYYSQWGTTHTANIWTFRSATPLTRKNIGTGGTSRMTITATTTRAHACHCLSKAPACRPQF